MPKGRPIFNFRLFKDLTTNPPGPLAERIVGYVTHQKEIPVGQQKIVEECADYVRNSYNPGRLPITGIELVGHADWDLKVSPQTVSENRAKQVRNMLETLVNDRRKWPKIAPNGATPASINWMDKGVGALEPDPKTLEENNRRGVPQQNWSMADRAKNRRVVIYLIPGTTPQPDLPPQDDFSVRVKRMWDLLQTRQVEPDSNGTRTRRTRCLLSRMVLNTSCTPGVKDIFVDGDASNEIINGRNPGSQKLVRYDGAYDPPDVSAADWNKFFDRTGVIGILKGPGFAPTVSDDQILKGLGNLVLRIDQGIGLTREYLKSKFDQIITGKYIGDQTRKKLENHYETRMNDPNDIYWCFGQRQI
jgi:hypothetical protein